jgi:high-affinity iron transporter
LWSTAWLLDDGSPLGNLVASLTGYRATPDLTQLAIYLAFWVLVWLALGTGGRRSARLRTSP